MGKALIQTQMRRNGHEENPKALIVGKSWAYIADNLEAALTIEQ